MRAAFPAARFYGWGAPATATRSRDEMRARWRYWGWKLMLISRLCAQELAATREGKPSGREARRQRGSFVSKGDTGSL